MGALADVLILGHHLQVLTLHPVEHTLLQGDPS